MISSLTKAFERQRNNTYSDIDGRVNFNQENFKDENAPSTDDFRGVPDPSDEILLTAARPGVVPDDTFTIEQAVNTIGFGKYQIQLSLLTGLCWMADSMEMMILAILSPTLRCQWRLSQLKQATLTSVVFMGMMISSTFWTNLSFQHGKKNILMFASAFMCIYAVLASMAPTFVWIIALRSVVGFCIGCFPQSVSLYGEFIPIKQKAKCVILLDCFWALGGCLEVLLALWIMPTLGWRWLLVLSIIPVAVFIFFSYWLPESAHHLAISGQTSEALKTLRRLAVTNNRPMLSGRLTLDDSTWTKGNIKDLFIPPLKRTTMLLWFIWWSCAFCYYGVVLMTAEFYQSSNICSSDYHVTCQANCDPLSTEDYIDLLWTTLAEFPGIFITVGLVEYIGCKKTMALEFWLYSVLITLLPFCFQSRMVMTVILFLVRGLISGVFQAAYIFSPEVYPTSLKSMGVSSCSTMSRLGAMLTPFVAQVLVTYSSHMATGLYVMVAILAGIASLLLPQRPVFLHNYL